MSLTQIATSGLLASQKALNVASNNIANAETEGYSRQTVQYSPTYTLYPGTGALGTGVSTSAVNRITSSFLTAQMWESQSLASESNIHAQYLNDLDQWLGNENTSLSKGFEQFFSALNGSSVDPYALSARQVVIAESVGLAERFNTLYAQLQGQATMVGQQLNAAADQANGLLANIAAFNDQLRSLSTGNQPANEILDQRDQAIRDLSELVSVNVLEQSDGSYSLYMKSGQPLILGNQFNALSANGQVDAANGFQLQLNTGNSEIPITGDPGGVIGGLMTYQSEELVQARNELGRLAVMITSEINDQLQVGEDLNGNSGAALFNDLTTPVGAVMALDMSSTAVSSLTIVNTSQLQASEYDFRVDNSGNYNLVRRSDGAQVAAGVLTGSGTDIIAFDGVEIRVDGTATDQLYRLSPVRFGAREIQTALTDPAALAFSAPGSGVGDNSNLLELVAIQSKGVLNNGQSTLMTAYSGFVGDIAVQTARMKTEADGGQALLSQAEAAVSTYSGVNLDEEAASILRFQQLYSANARVISVARTTFDALLAMF
ncbi:MULTISPECIES: flagellar hook-associated protein FlgK [Gammaproteobacteria]|uniref:flagellar hook-associated protein FlgK n=1 Tax=Gammaproteobacteria TaxID=1236 RepID=UPI001AD9F911|nr:MULTISPECIES: flagellar hook-associated protein FlgK [Gammaproteobacteria]MBO9480830.1 flagellar hook-associated protein FlgK [Salinisphaera sp. G21_0]MBO9495244.1 flagellar hook-associated protein FlgK [Thalassotalea sp. G20_0]